MSTDNFSQSVFIADLPKEFKLAELSELLESFGRVTELERMQDGHIRVRFQDAQAAKKCFVKAKNGGLNFKEVGIRVMPKSVPKNRK